MNWLKTPEGYARGSYRVTRRGPKWWARFHPQGKVHAEHVVSLGMHESPNVARQVCERHASDSGN